MIAVGVLALASMTASADKTKKPEAVIVDPKTMQWTDGPPDLPKGAQMVVLRGDPTKSGQFTLRFKMPDGYKVPPHWHTHDEELTILSGMMVLHMGDTMDAPAHDLAVDAYHFLPAKLHHGAEAKGETVVQLSGPGPFDIHYLNAADNPNPKTAKK